jgi:hypothetical protein
MNPSQAILNAQREGAPGREAPSSIINASQSLVALHAALGCICLALAVVFGWRTLLSLRWEEVLLQWEGHAPLLDKNKILILTGVAGILPMVNAIAFFRCARALRKFCRTHLVTDLYPAMCRLRAVWRTLSLTVSVVILVPVTLIIIRHNFGLH